MTPTAVTSTPRPAPADPQRQTLGQSEFIRLMTTQMTMQDPTAPVDNSEMIAQMAQFSSLSGIEQINTTLTAIAARIDQLAARGDAGAATPTPPQGA